MPELWERIERKLAECEGHLSAMDRAVFALRQQRPNPRYEGCRETWEPAKLWAAVNSFVTTTRSVAYLLKATYSEDSLGRIGSPMHEWWTKTLGADEKARRAAFKLQAAGAIATFMAEPLGDARDDAIHRTGQAPLFVRIEGKHYDTAESVPMELPVEHPPDAPPGNPSARPLQPPNAEDFFIGSAGGPLPLFDACGAYLRAARKLAEDVRPIASGIHDGKTLTSPPEF